ncbi:MAG: PCC domain-containing protein [Limisphaerales bacterium]
MRIHQTLLVVVLVICGCATTTSRKYPANWWAPVPTNGAPAWEIFPQDAKAGEVILSKRNELGLLSNFAPTPFTFRSKRYASIEGFWQAMKFPENGDDARATFPGLDWPYTRAQVERMSSFEAKRAGDIGSANMKKMGINWVTFEGRQFEYRPVTPGEQYQFIVGAMRAKVLQNARVRKVLLSTGDLILKPDHKQEQKPPAAWRYYDILMQIRFELQNAHQRSLSSKTRVHMLRLNPHDDLRLALEGYTRAHHLRAGFIVTAVGSLESAKLRLADQKDSTEFSGKFEIVSLVGTLSPDGPHLHISLSDNTGKTIGGHLVEGCKVYTTAEIVIGEANNLHFTRPLDQQTGFNELVIERVTN